MSLQEMCFRYNSCHAASRREDPTNGGLKNILRGTGDNAQLTLILLSMDFPLIGGHLAAGRD